jgi:Fe-S cluster biogenesis protein NfuA
MNLSKQELESKIIESIDQLRPYLMEDGGDMELIELTDEGIVRVKLLGACSDCSMSPMTLRAGLEEAVKSISSQIKGVEAVNLVSIHG